MRDLKPIGWATMFLFTLALILIGDDFDIPGLVILGFSFIGWWLAWTWSLISRPKGDRHAVYFTSLSKEELERAREYVERNIERNSSRSDPAHRKGTKRESEERSSGSPYQSESGSED